MTRQAIKKITPSGITSLSVKGFKSIVDTQTIAIRPLTLLAGANSSGKSSVMQALLLLKQTLEAPFDPGPLLLNGPCVKFTSISQLVPFKHDAQVPHRIEISITVDEAVTNDFVFTPQEKSIDLKVVTKRNNNIEVNQFEEGMSHEQIEAMLPSELLEGIRGVMPEITMTTERDRFFIDVYVSARTRKGRPRTDATTGLNISPAPNFRPYISGCIHLPGLRGSPERDYPVTAVGSVYPGTFENYTASVISKWQETQNQNLTILGRQLLSLGLTNRVLARHVNDIRVELLVGRVCKKTRSSEDADMVSVADVGLGVSQTLPVLVALLAAKPGQLVYLEQPEIHLHPKAQHLMATVLADAAKRGVRVVAETHSSLLLLGIQSLIAEGKLNADVVKLHWFTRDKAGSTIVKSADIDDAGSFGDWPEDFDDVEIAAQNRFLTASEKRAIS